MKARKWILELYLPARGGNDRGRPSLPHHRSLLQEDLTALHVVVRAHRKNEVHRVADIELLGGREQQPDELHRLGRANPTGESTVPAPSEGFGNLVIVDPRTVVVVAITHSREQPTRTVSLAALHADL